MLVSCTDVDDVFTFEAEVPDVDVGGNIGGPKVTQMEPVVGIWQGSCDYDTLRELHPPLQKEHIFLALKGLI